MTKVKIHENRMINGIEYTSLSLDRKRPIYDLLIPDKWARPFLFPDELEEPTSIGFNVIYKASQFNILHFGEAQFEDQIYCLISTSDGFYVERVKEDEDRDEEIYPSGWRGLLAFIEGYSMFNYLQALYKGRAWYAVPKEYCEMRQNICYKKIPGIKKFIKKFNRINGGLFLGR